MTEENPPVNISTLLEGSDTILWVTDPHNFIISVLVAVTTESTDEGEETPLFI